MAPYAIVIGVLLIGLGAWGYFGAPLEKQHWTALIPAFVGGPLLILGLLALQEHLRKHAMHAAAAVGLLGFLGGAADLLRRSFTGKLEWGAPVVSGALMAVLCAVFVGLCVKSFIDARRAQARRAADEASPQI